MSQPFDNPETDSQMEVTGDVCEEHSTDPKSSKERKISIIILGSGDSLKKALITNILGKDLSSLSKRETERKLKIYENDTYEFICTPSYNPACENIKELVDKHPDMWLLVVEDGVSPEDVQQQIEKLHKTTEKPADEFRVVQPVSCNLTDSPLSNFYTLDQIVREVRKLGGDRDLMPSNKRPLDNPEADSQMEATGDECSEEHSTDPKKISKGNHSSNKINLVVLGMAGTGKSASGNTILGYNHFMSRASSKPVTTECEMKETEINGTCVRVIDTPDIFDDEIKSSVKNQHVTKCKQFCKQQPCVYLLVMHVSRFTDGERDILEKFEKAFGSEAKEQTVILFTRGEELQRADMSLEGFLQDCQPDLKNIVNQCGRRCVVFDNKASRQPQVTKLMQTVIMMLNKQQKQ